MTTTHPDPHAEAALPGPVRPGLPDPADRPGDLRHHRRNHRRGIAGRLPGGHGRHAVHGAQLRPDGHRLSRGRFRLHLRPPVHRSQGGVPGGLGHPAGLPVPAHGHLAHRRLLPDCAVPRDPDRSLDCGLHPHHHGAEHPGHQGGGQGQLRADGVPAAGHRVLRGAVHRQRGVHLRAPAAWSAPSRSSTTPPASPPSRPVPPSPRTRSSGSTPSPPSPRRPSTRARTCPAPSCSSR